MHFHFDTLKNLIDNNPLNINNIKKSYIDLLSQLTSINDLSIDLFIERINLISTNNNIIYVCYTNDFNVIGTGTIIIEPKLIHNCSYVGHIEDVVTNNNYRGLGIAKNIINYLIHYGQNIGCYKIILDCNEELINFYKNNNFIIKGFQMAIYT